MLCMFVQQVSKSKGGTIHHKGPYTATSPQIVRVERDIGPNASEETSDVAADHGDYGIFP